jgi:hypothetical protein
VEVAKPGDIGVAHAREQLARPRPLHLEVRDLERLLLHLDVHVGADAAEVISVRVEGCDDQHVVLGLAAVADAVADHLPVLVAEGCVADLPDLEIEHVVREDPVGGLQGVGPGEVPLAQGRLVPDADALANGSMLRGWLRNGWARANPPIP